MKKPFDPQADYQPESFDFADPGKVEEILNRYPKGFRKSAVMPLLDLAQRQMAEEGAKADPPFGGWIPRAAMDKIAEILDQPRIKVYEVATFYSMYYLAPVGRYLVQVCTTTPCWLCNSDAVIRACQDHLDLKTGQSTDDMMFTLVEVECLGACVNAPMVQINDHYYEDLTPERMVAILDDLKAGREPGTGSQAGRRGSMAESGPTTLEEQAEKAGLS